MARDDAGNFLFAFAALMQCNNHHVAEVIASNYAGQWLKEKLDSMTGRYVEEQEQ